MDCAISRQCTYFSAILIWNVGTFVITFWVTSYVDDSINYTQLGGTYEILSGAQAGTQVFGQDPLWLAWATDLVNLKGGGDMSKYQFVLENWTPTRFKVGQMIGSSGILMGMALAMYRNVDADKKLNINQCIFLL